MADKESKDTTKKTEKKSTDEKEVKNIKNKKKEDNQTQTITGLGENVEAILVYLIPILGFIFSLMKDRKVSKNAKFCYNQAGTIWLVNIILNVISSFIGTFMSPIRWVSYPLTVVLFIFSLIALIKAYNGERYEIPIISDISKSIWGELD